MVYIFKLISTKSKRNTKQKPVTEEKPVDSSMPEPETHGDNARADLISSAMSKAVDRAKNRKKTNSFFNILLRKIKDIPVKLSYATMQTKITIVATLSFVMLGGIGALFFTVVGATAVNSVVTIEAGEKMPGAVVFARNPGDKIEYISDVSDIKLSKVGDIGLTVLINNVTYEVTLKVVDTIAPVATPVSISIAKGESLHAENFVTDIIDATDVVVRYEQMPDFNSIGKHNIKVILEDEGENNTIYDTWMYVFDINNGITIEAGTDMLSIPVHSFLIQDESLAGMYYNINITFAKGIDQENANQVGEYEVNILLGDTIFASKITVVDTTAPTGNAVHVNSWIGKNHEPLDFIENVHDYSDFTARFHTVPDYSYEGTQEVLIILEDIWGNASTFYSTLTLQKDTIPPEITGAEDFTVTLGSNILYRVGVTAWDNADGEIDFEVDSSAVDINKVGKYPVIYTAVDSSGNVTIVQITVTIAAFSRSSAEDLADSVLSGIINQSMSQTEKARAIHRWVRNNITYSGNAERDKHKAAYGGLMHRNGDCFTYYAVSSLMLDRAGIRNIQIRRTPGARPTNHWWNLIQIGGVWYHFDACPNNHGFHGFMFTAADAIRLNADPASLNYYAYDPALYPRIAGATDDSQSSDSNEQQADIITDNNNNAETDTGIHDETDTGVHDETDTGVHDETDTEVND